MKKIKINDYDLTKNMLNTIRTINEAVEEEDEVKVKQISNDGETELESTYDKPKTEVDSVELTLDEKKEEESDFRAAVSPRVEFDTFNVYPTTNNVIFSGTLQTMGGLKWQFTLDDEDGVYITANNVQLSDASIDTIGKLKGYYMNWADKWSEKLATEYHGDDENDVVMD